MITGYLVHDCPFCRADQSYLHLRQTKPFAVRCARCGAHGPQSASPDEAVRRWNGYATGVANGTGKKGGAL